MIGDLTFAALFHDVGKLSFPEETLASSSPEKRDAVKRHPLLGARHLLHSGRVVSAVVRSMNVAYLHHKRFDGTGHPETMKPMEQNLVTRIVAVVNTYDGFTMGPPYAPKPLLPAAALARVNDLAASALDPILVKVFVNLMGLYPIGSLVRLDSGELASVVRPHQDPALLHRPLVRIFSAADGSACEQIVDLAEKESGYFLRSIDGSFQPGEIELELGEYLSVI
jgi:HD-GYP domain-containing protein (c-di-GMP phosphodiesterase class II)